ncbi:MAG: NAD-dependent epimerase/dehydratase family protein [Maricaulaceae bacterium]|nr:NAD-dependent epimerase/dehydratase family protein [Maricaulaceae bacterium]
MTILVTGAAGFIGYHACEVLLARGETVTGVDSLNDYYDPALKQARLARLQGREGFSFHRLDIAEADALKALTLDARPDRILHLAAQAGVRYSIDNPHAYARSNLDGQLSVLEAARALGGDLKHLVYASSSSVYGEREGPFRESDRIDAPVSLYAATKGAGELMCAAYARLYGIPATGLRFFTVYGPWGRPDMAYWLFADAMVEGRALKLFNEGRNRRDFTYVDDIVAPMLRVLADDPARAAHRIYNIGGSHPHPTADLVRALEAALGVKAQTEAVPAQPGDVSLTYADVSKLAADYGYAPTVDLQTGIARFAEWFRDWRAQTS